MTNKTTDESTGAKQAAKLNLLLDKIAERLISQDKRIAALEEGMAAVAKMLALARRALDGHQVMIEALAPSKPQPRPQRAVN